MFDPHFPLPASVLNSFGDAIIVADLEDRITIWNTGAEQVFGWTAAEMTGETPERLFAAPAPDTWSAIKCEAQRAEEHRADHQGITRTGETVWLSLSVTPLQDRGAQMVGMLIVARDVSRRREREAERLRLLAEHRQQHSTLRALLYSMADGVFLVDNRGWVSVCSAPLEELVEVRPAEVIGQPYTTLFDQFLPLAEEPQVLRHDLQRALEQVHELPVIYLTLRQPRARLLQLQFFPVEDDTGESLGWGGLVRDLTRADETNVLATVSHELRTPLAAIKGYVTTLLDNFRRWEPAAVEEFLETIDEGADQLSGLVENMLDMSRLETGILRLQRRPLELPDLAAQVVEQVELRTRRCQFVIQFAEDFPQPRADRLRVEQVLRNLLQNAVRYSLKGGVITISGEAAESKVIVRVQDEGVGIPVEEQERVFERFYQAEGAPAGHSGGAGLGLYLCRRIVEAHGGRIWLERPESGVGSCFAFQLPLGPTPAAEAAASTLAAAAQPAGMRPADAVRVVVVEDDRRLVRFIKANLESSGYEVFTALDGEVAIEVVERESPHLILLDLMLPKMDGYAVCARVREFSQAPIVIITARTEEADVVRGLDLGADDYLTKPFGTKELLARVRAVLRRSRFPEEVQAQPTLARGDLAIDFARRQVTVGGREVSLTPTEYKMLYHLAINAGQVLTHEQLLHKVWGTAYETESTYLWVYISRLRKKLEPDPDNPRYILTETGIGYRFAG